MTIEAAGYIVHDGYVIHGYGATREEAWEVMLGVVHHGGTEVVEDDALAAAADLPPDSWVRASSFKTLPATTALLALVDDSGGACVWGNVGGVACTVAEEDALKEED